MSFRSAKAARLDGDRMPDSIFASVVASLYHDPRPLIISTACTIFAAVVIYFRTHDVVQLHFASFFILFGAACIIRWRDFKVAFDKKLSRQENQAWETKYVVIGGFYFMLLGSWYALSINRSDDSYVQLLTLFLTSTNLIGLVGVSFSSARVIKVHACILSFFMIVGTLMVGKSQNIILAALMIPIFAAAQLICIRLRQMLFDTELKAVQNSLIAERFDATLNNVTHGIAMFDQNGEIVVANERFTQLAGLDDWDIVGCNLSILKATKIHSEHEKNLGEVIAECLESTSARHFTFGLTLTQVVEADYSPMPRGGVLLLSDVSERKASEKEFRELANFDPLTNLPNRRFFIAEVRRSLEDYNGVLKPCSMFFIDLDKFKEVNDTLGHGIGDDLLVGIAERLNSILKPGGTICRFGGDEFVVIIPEMTVEEECAAFAREIISELSRPVSIDGTEINVGASVGIAIAPRDAQDAELLLQYSDAALYKAKTAGRGRHVFYNKSIGDTIRLRRELELDLRKAIREETLELYYQPLINLKRGGITTCEALLRWNHPERGMISPGEFIPLAEETGLIVELGAFVLKRAMSECLTWDDKTRVAVNVSTVQFQRTDVTTLVSGLLKETGLPADRLEIEITESAMMDDLDEVTRALNAISGLGVKISLDDFGTGFSNLSYLYALPFDKVKIDRSFIENAIANERSLVLLKGVVDLLKRLRLSVVLEGIENEAQIEILSNHIGVDEVQGFLFGRPMPQKDIHALINSIGEKADPEGVTMVA